MGRWGDGEVWEMGRWGDGEVWEMGKRRKHKFSFPHTPYTSSISPSPLDFFKNQTKI
jgi:hypothetical protein